MPTVLFRVFGHPFHKPSVEEVVGTVLSWATYYVFYFQPGLDRRAVLRAEFDWWPGEPTFGLLLVSFMVVLGLPALILASYWVVYHFEFPCLERYRVENWKRIGWNNPDPIKRAEYVALNKLSLRTFVPKQVTLMLLVTAYLLYTRWAGEWTAAKMQYEIDNCPDVWTSIWQIGVGLLIFETIFYWGHRIQHRYFYESHKIHHEYHIPNVLTAPWGADADGWLTLFLPGFLPAIMFRMHMWTFLMWTTIHYSHTYLDHSGYEFPWCPIQLIPFSGHVRAHDFHHTANVCNYGLYWRFWDWIMGTEKAWLEHEAKRELRIRTTGTADTASAQDKTEYPAAYETSSQAAELEKLAKNN